MNVILLYLAFSTILIWESTCDRNSSFICEDGNQIDLEKACDGIKHCTDASDESKKLCYHIICPENTFRCHYGACIPKKLRCDGIHHCSDKSDEINCIKYYQTCKENEFKCLYSGKCISYDLICDDKKDCEDNSDEDICDDVLCPLNTYRCKHGGCIHLSQRCDGYKDCADGSDESTVLCQSLNCFGDSCNEIQKNISCPPITSTRIFVKCEVPFGVGRGIVPCNKPVPIGTIASYKCKPHYKPANMKHVSNTKMMCQLDGTWNRECLKCIPECGVAQPDVAPLIINGMTIKQEEFPWHAVLYALESGTWEFICGGNLINEKIVLTAAHCTWEMPLEVFKVAVGKYYSDYYKKEDTSIIRNVQEIIRHPLYQDFNGNYGSDIAILVLDQSVEFSSAVRPVCVDWTLSDIAGHLKSNNLGLIVGMGLTENDTFSDKLRAAYLPVVADEKCIQLQKRDFKKYITFTSFCAGWRNGTGVCNGDSGGGLVFKFRDKWVLQGIVSVSPRRPGTSYCDPSYFTVFTKVGMYVTWIHKVLQEFPVDIIQDPIIGNNVVL